MRKNLFILLMGFGMILLSSSFTLAASKDDGLDEAIENVNHAALNEDGRKIIEERLEQRYKVDEDTIRGLRTQNFNYGEIAAILSLTQRMVNGATRSNIAKVTVFRIGRDIKNWDDIAQQFHTSPRELKRNIYNFQQSIDFSKNADAALDSAPKDNRDAEDLKTQRNPNNPVAPVESTTHDETPGIPAH